MSHIEYRHNGELSALVGKDAVELMRVGAIISGLKLYLATGGRMILTRGATIGNLLKMVTPYTGRTYKRKEAAQAMADLKVWFETMKSSLPIEVK